VVLGLMAFGAQAQATTGAKWLILTAGGQLEEGATLHASVIARKDIFKSPFVLHTEILKIKVLFLCESVSVVNANLQKEGTIAREFDFTGKSVGSQIRFSFCSTDLNGVFTSECTPTDPFGGASTIYTKLGHALLVLGSFKEDLLKLLPDEGETSATVTLPAGCPIGTKVPVLGTVTLKDCENLALAHLFEHLFESGPGTELWAISKTEEHKATLLGSAWASLFGEHINLTWSGDPA